ncbi:MAG: YihY/virulence factor BrkB family protein [Tannerella sp.]|nr:YihY/virulence factor BrkB family protein [Tannerella sp.]
MSGIKSSYIHITKTIILAIRGYNRDNIDTRASALTYSTILAIVPLLAVVVGVATGFGMRETVRTSVYTYFPGHKNELSKAFDFAENYLSMSQGGVFIGIGLIILFYTVYNLISTIEFTFNEIWQVKQQRSLKRKITDYMAMFVVLPAMLAISSGLSLFISTLSNTFLQEYLFLTPVSDFFLHLAPYVITFFFFTALYMIVPNTKVKFLNALAAGFVVGCAFQVFQNLYINGVIWVSKYNAIYGSFAALPLLFLWLQLSWLITLFGAEIAYASQNVKKFSFERDSKNVSRRYKDFLTILIVSIIAKRFENREKPLTADELSDVTKIPIRLTTDILYLLTELSIITEIRNTEDESAIYYQPAFDINKLTISFLLSKIDGFGSENFYVDIYDKYNNEWLALLKARSDMYEPNHSVLLKDL